MTERETPIEEVIRVLVVEDDDALRLSFPRVLGMMFDATLAATVSEALAHLNEPVAFHCVLSDFNLRDGLGRDGIWLLSEARVIQPWARRVLYTGSAPGEFGAHLAPGLLHGQLLKPATSTKLRRLLRDLAGAPKRLSSST